MGNPVEVMQQGMEGLNPKIDKDILTGLIVKECGALTPMYDNTTWFWINHTLWFNVNKDVINHLFETLNYKYSPIHNYDMDRDIKNQTTGHEEGAESRTKDMASDGTSTGNKTYKSTENEKLGGKDELKHAYASNISDEGDGTSQNTQERNLTTQTDGETHEEKKTSAYNELLYQPDNTTDEEHSETVTQTGTVSDNGGYTDNNTRKHTGNDTDTTTYGKTKETIVSDDVTDTSNTEHKEGSEEEHANDERDKKGTNDTQEKGFGATGIYTKQQMIQQERDLAKFNLYEWIVRKYKRDNFLLVY